MNLVLLLIPLMISASTPALGVECQAPLSQVEEAPDQLGVPLYYVSGRLRLLPDPSVLTDGTSVRPTTLGFQLWRIRSFLGNPERLKDTREAYALSYDLITVSVALSWKAKQSGSPEMQRLADSFEGLESLFNLACRQATYLKYEGMRYSAWIPLPPMTEARPVQLSATLRMARMRLRWVEFYSERARLARGERL